MSILYPFFNVFNVSNKIKNFLSRELTQLLLDLFLETWYLGIILKSYIEKIFISIKVFSGIEM